MAERIQSGERAKGEKDFWGFVWPGAASEGLTCAALEWQAADGGGGIIEPDGTISVNNPLAIHAWERAAHWVGWISPPSVTSYQEWDTSNAFLNSGRAAFYRGWTSDYFLSYTPDLPFVDKAGATSVPGGKSERVGTLGGFGLAVSRFSAHPAEAIKFVQFLSHREAQLEEKRSRSEPPKRPELYELPTILQAYAHFRRPEEKPRGAVIIRPSTVTGQKYAEVSNAYVQAVHSVLNGEAKGAEAAATLAKKLASMTVSELRSPTGKF